MNHFRNTRAACAMLGVRAQRERQPNDDDISRRTILREPRNFSSPEIQMVLERMSLHRNHPHKIHAVKPWMNLLCGEYKDMSTLEIVHSLYNKHAQHGRFANQVLTHEELIWQETTYPDWSITHINPERNAADFKMFTVYAILRLTMEIYLPFINVME